MGWSGMVAGVQQPPARYSPRVSAGPVRAVPQHDSFASPEASRTVPPLAGHGRAPPMLCHRSAGQNRLTRHRAKPPSLDLSAQAPLHHAVEQSPPDNSTGPTGDPNESLRDSNIPLRHTIPARAVPARVGPNSPRSLAVALPLSQVPKRDRALTRRSSSNR